MKLALVGIGGAGTRIVNQILETERDTGRAMTGDSVLTFNTKPPAEEDITAIPSDRRVIIGDTYPGVEGTGVNADPDLAVAVTREDRNEIHRAFDELELFDLDAIMLVGGFGGGTGSGTLAVLVRALQSTVDIPVYVCGILPAESENDRRVLNAARALPSIVPAADNVLLCDNDAWYDGQESLVSAYESINEALATRIVSVFGAGELASKGLAEQHIDPSDIMRTLATGGVSTLGYAETTIERPNPVIRLLRKLLGKPPVDSDGTEATTITSLVKETVTGRLTLPCAVNSAERTAIVLSGPPGAISRKGFETSRYWLEETADTVEVLAGDEPRPGNGTITATVVLSNVTDVPRIEAMQSRAVAAQESASGSGVSFEDDD